MHSRPPPRQGPFAALRRFVRPQEKAERCELCGCQLLSEHLHLAEPAARRLLCCCDACALLFSSGPAGRYRRIPTRLEFLPDFRMTDARWGSLGVPVHLAFFYHSTPASGVTAVYPSVAGALESLVAPQAWEALAEENPVLRELEPDVEALLVNRVEEARDYYRASLDRCYELVGTFRALGRISGGPELPEEVRRFFAALRAQSPKGTMPRDGAGQRQRTLG